MLVAVARAVQGHVGLLNVLQGGLPLQGEGLVRHRHLVAVGDLDAVWMCAVGMLWRCRSAMCWIGRRSCYCAASGSVDSVPPRRSSQSHLTTEAGMARDAGEQRVLFYCLAGRGSWSPLEGTGNVLSYDGACTMVGNLHTLVRVVQGGQSP
jgi:hypothetical protein